MRDRPFKPRSMTKLIDVTVPLSAACRRFPATRVPVGVAHQMSDGEPYNVAQLGAGHARGHPRRRALPLHAAGRRWTQLPLEILMGKVRVVDLTAATPSTARTWKLDLREDLRVLLKTRNSGPLRQPSSRKTSST